MPLYLVESLGEQAESLATVPLVAYIASFLASLGVKAASGHISSKVLCIKFPSGGFTGGLMGLYNPGRKIFRAFF